MTSKTLNTAATVLFGALATLTAVAPRYSHAADGTVAVHRRVSYAGLDLNSPDGAHTLYTRLKSAARSLCSEPDAVYRAHSSVYRECMQDALARVVRDANRSLLTQMFVSDYGADVAAHFGIDNATRVAKH